MKTFQDNAGRTWTIDINIDAVKRVRTLCQVDLLDAVRGKLLELLSEDPILLCDLLYALCRDEALANNVTDEEFGRALAGDVIEHATLALLEELVAFFPPGKRRVLAKALKKLAELKQMALDVAEQRLDSLELNQTMAQTLTGSGGSSGSLPASSAATPAP